MDIPQSASPAYNQSIIHLDGAIERHLGTALDQASNSLVNEIQNEFESICASTAYAKLVKELAQHPPPILKRKKPKKNKSFSLFDMMDANAFGGTSMGSSSLSLPPNIRDILSCEDSIEILEKCNDARVQDLILGFNTAEEEVQKLSALLHGQLHLECEDGTSSLEASSVSFLALHKKWIQECIKDGESFSFAFLLICNVFLISSRSNDASKPISIQQRFKIVKCLMDIMQCVLEVWNDTFIFQKALLETLHLWIKCSFQIGTKETHLAWSYYDPKGNLFQKYLAAINSTLLIRLAVEKTGLLPYLKDALSATSNEDKSTVFFMDGAKISIINTEELISNHSLCLFSSVVMNSSAWTFPFEHVSTRKLVQSIVPSFTTIKDDMSWILNLDKELKHISETKYNHPTRELIEEHLLGPFISYLKANRTAEIASSYSSRKVARIGEHDQSFIKICLQSIKHILLCCRKDPDLLSQLIDFCKMHQPQIDWQSEIHR